MSTEKSLLFDPLLKESNYAKIKGTTTSIFESLSKKSPKNIILNFVIPVTVVVGIAFFLRKRYDRQQEKVKEYGKMAGYGY